MPIFVDPRAVSHVDLDPIGAILQLFARDLAHLDHAVAKLRALRNNDVRVIALEWISTCHRNGARHYEHPRAGNVSGIDRFLDPQITVPCAFGLHIADRGEPLLERAPCRYHRTGSPER